MKLRATWVLVAAPSPFSSPSARRALQQRVESPEGTRRGVLDQLHAITPLVCAFSLLLPDSARASQLRPRAAGESLHRDQRRRRVRAPGRKLEGGCAMGKACTGALQCGPDQQCRSSRARRRTCRPRAPSGRCAAGPLLLTSGSTGPSAAKGGSSSGSEAGQQQRRRRMARRMVHRNASKPVRSAHVPSNLETVNTSPGQRDSHAGAGWRRPPSSAPTGARLEQRGGRQHHEGLQRGVPGPRDRSCPERHVARHPLPVVKTLTVASGQTLTLNGEEPGHHRVAGVDIRSSVNVQRCLRRLLPWGGRMASGGHEQRLREDRAPGVTPRRHVPRRAVAEAARRHRRQGGRRRHHSARREHYGNAQNIPHPPPRRVGPADTRRTRAIRASAAGPSRSRRRRRHHPPVRGVGFINAGARELGGGASSGAILLEAHGDNQGTLAAGERCAARGRTTPAQASRPRNVAASWVPATGRGLRRSDDQRHRLARRAAAGSHQLNGGGGGGVDYQRRKRRRSRRGDHQSRPRRRRAWRWATLARPPSLTGGGSPS